MRLLKWLFGLGVGFAGLIAMAVLVVELAGLPIYEVAVEELEIDSTKEQRERGRTLVAGLCVRCHFDPGTGKLSGRRVSDLPERLGKIYAPNITNDRRHGLATWSDGQLAYLLRTGVNPRTQRFIPPYMIRLPRMADADLHAIIAFLRSDHAWVAAEPSPDKPSEPSLWVKYKSYVDWSPSGYPRLPIETPSIDDPVAYGQYLVDDALQCTACHGSKGRHQGLEPASGAGYLAGGGELPDVAGKPLYVANITVDVDTGIGAWSYRDFRRVITDGFRPDNSLVRWPMPRYPSLTEPEVEAIYAYLETVPAVTNEVRVSKAYRVGGARLSPGKHAFFQYGCHYCHPQPGVGLADLSQASRKFDSDDALIKFLKDPSSVQLHTAWDGVIADEDYAPIARYVRTLGQGEDSLL